ncbi:MAG: exonuclease subunit SbcD, partial [Spirochaetaceae bacterium]|nr:exonuclease subunit SbcD [Spirochaetaceae bacterium]
MTFLHVSDLHLGKLLCGYDLLDDQAYMLGQLLELAGKVRPAALLVAGDVYDRPVPPVEAIRLFDSFLMDLRRNCPGIRIVVIPGNHDSAGRLSFGSSLMADTGVMIQAAVPTRPATVIEKGGERAALWAIPFLSQAKALWPEDAE